MSLHTLAVDISCIVHSPKLFKRKYSLFSCLRAKLLSFATEFNTKMTLTHNDYTVAWICALPPEMAAAKSMLDENHNNLSQHETDYNSYALGRLHVHNVVISCLPSGVYGTISAARVLSNMLSTFRSLHFVFMVGIGGGVPSESTDVRLGDVVVSIPHKTVGGVIQYDYGKACDGNFERIGSLNKPPQIILTSISQIRSNYMLGKGLVQQNISNVLRKNHEMRTEFSRPSQDLLFSSAYNHQSGNLDCSKCDRNQLVHRAPRTKETQIHYGMIASGNMVIKDAKQRDSIAQDSDILCFEMEAAGLMDQLPCLVIRGISDYCDSHKSQDWQSYAALSAASYTKELLEIVPSSTYSHADITMLCQKNPSQQSSAVTMTQELAHHRTSTIYSGITINPKEITDYFGTSIVRRANDLPKASSAIKTCKQTCLCNCHKRHLVKSPPFMRPIMGTFFLRYQGASFFRSSCDEATCRNNKSGSLEAIYCFPGWLIDITFIISGSPSYGLNFPRRLGWGSIETILKSAYEGNVEGLKVLLSNSSYALHDIDQKHGRTALHVSHKLFHWNYARDDANIIGSMRLCVITLRLASFFVMPLLMPMLWIIQACKYADSPILKQPIDKKNKSVHQQSKLGSIS
jgi:nucleoside phosphorylase